MASRRPSHRTTTLVLAGVAGVVLAHGLDYALAVRSAGARRLLLTETGHAWWASAVGAALGAACLAVSMATARGAAGVLSRRALDTATTSHRRELGWMALWQTGLFTAVEVVERAAAHRSPLELLHGPLFPLGLFLQVLVAGLVVAGLRLLERTGATVAAALAAARRGRRATRRPAFLAVVGGKDLLAGTPGASEARGPPLSLVA